ncbi:MAG: glycoside hydrolase family 5 protein [Treponema sp.]|nr:glycoside hydrolase family 5 protein [Treponema sp.]
MINVKRFILATVASAMALCSVYADTETKVRLAKKVGELSWTNTVTFPDNKFKNAEEGSVIRISATQTKADYHKLKVYAMTNGWTELGYGGVSGADFSNGEISMEKPSGTIIITLSQQEAQNLRKYGLAMHGFGISVKKVELRNPEKEEGLFDLGNWQSFGIPASQFQGLDDFSIQIITNRSPTEKDAAYFNIKLYVDNTNPWRTVYKGKVSSAEGDARIQDDLIFLAKTDNSLIYTPTDKERAAIKENGLRIQGYGMLVMEVNTVTENGQPLTAEEIGEASAEPNAAKGTPFARHGKLHVTGASLYDSKDQKFQLYGMSTHGLSWFPEYVSDESFATLRNDWNANCVRLAMYPGDYNGYCNGGNQEELKNTVCKGIEAATAQGMYVIVDWHVHNDNPNKYKEEAKKFLGEISKKYAGNGNILYEICNEPVDSDWDSQIKPYAEEIIPVIRANSPDSIIIVGTNTWSQDVDKAVANQIKTFKNIMYTFHFYAHTHTDDMRAKLENAIKLGLPVFITEFGTCDASGNGGYDENQTMQWFNLIQKYNLSHINWSLCNKDETASAISSDCKATSGWTENELSQSGKLIRSHFRTLKK